MKVLILAAGLGSRLKELTKDKPKCLVKVDGKPIIEYQLDAIRQNGLKDIIVVTGYKHEVLKEFLEQDKFKDLNIKIIENKDYEETNSAYSWLIASEEIKDDTYIHLNCDIIFYSELLGKMLNAKENSILTNRNIKLNGSMEQAVVDKSGRITSMVLGENPNAVGRASGMSKLSPTNIKKMEEKMEELLKAGERKKHCYGLIRQTLSNVSYFSFDSGTSFFREINNPDELVEAEEAVKKYNKC